MRTDAPLKTRHQEILSSIVRAYIETGEPVGSRTLFKRRKDELSPASIRNAMADLADEGYLSQPHTSAGRIPTEKAFRFYVSSLAVTRVAYAEADRLSNEFSALDTVGARVERSSFILMEMTRNVGIAAALPALSQELDQIELIPLAENRVLTIPVTRGRRVRNKVGALEDPVGVDELISIRNYIKRNFHGWQLGEARRELVRRLLEDRELFQAAMRKVQVLYQKGLLD